MLWTHAVKIIIWTWIGNFIKMHNNKGSARGVAANELDCGIVVRVFELQSRYYVHFRTNTLGKRYEPPNLYSYGLNSNIIVLYTRMFSALNNPKRLICH